MCGEPPYLVRAKTKFSARFDNYESAYRTYTKINVKYHSSVFMNIMGSTLIEQCQTHEQLKESETFWQQKLKTCFKTA